MRREKLGDRVLRPEAEFIDHLPRTAAHAFPEWHGLSRVIPRLRHQSEADVIRFGLLLAIKRQRHVDAISAQKTLDGASARRNSGRSADGPQLGDLIDDAAAHALYAMALQRVSDFVSHHGRETGIRLGVLQNAGKRSSLPPR